MNDLKAPPEPPTPSVTHYSPFPTRARDTNSPPTTTSATVGNETELARELDAKKLRHEPLHWISHNARTYDAYSAEARQIYFKHIKKGLLDVGVDALWMDGTEVEVAGACHNAADVERDIKSLGMNAMGDSARYLNYGLARRCGTCRPASAARMVSRTAGKPL